MVVPSYHILGVVAKGSLPIAGAPDKATGADGEMEIVVGSNERAGAAVENPTRMLAGVAQPGFWYLGIG